jgi:choline dehydrogenase-like flavoprotein
MATDLKRGVVDADCRVHGTPNLFVAGSAVFPTSGQANPTLLITAFSARLAAHVARLARQLPPPQSEHRENGALAGAVMPSFTSDTQTAPIEAAE